MTLFHYTGVMQFAGIFREGLTRGEIASLNLSYVKQAISFTTQTNPDKLECWGEPVPQKTAVRLTCQFEPNEPKLEPTIATWKREGVSPADIRILNPNGQAKWWYYYHGTIPPEKFTVELRSKDGYRTPTAEQLAMIGEVLAKELVKYDIETPHPQFSLMRVAYLKEGFTGPWLLNEVFPADRFSV